MKALRIAFIATGIVLSTAAYSQIDTSKVVEDQSTTPEKMGSVTDPSTTTQQPMTATNIQVFPQPNFGRYYIPVLGSYTSSTETSEPVKNVMIAGDEQNPGRIWIEGLTTEKIYALKKPGKGFYKIPAQKVADKNIDEGTVMYDDNSKQVNICLGCKYIDASPADAFTRTEKTTTTKKNSKAVKTTPVINFTGNKTNGGVAGLN